MGMDMEMRENKNRQIVVYREPVGSRTPIEGTGILYSIH